MRAVIEAPTAPTWDADAALAAAVMLGQYVAMDGTAFEMTQLLIDKGYSPAATHRPLWFALHGNYRGDGTSAKLLLRHGADLGAEDCAALRSLIEWEDVAGAVVAMELTGLKDAQGNVIDWRRLNPGPGVEEAWSQGMLSLALEQRIHDGKSRLDLQPGPDNILKSEGL